MRCTQFLSIPCTLEKLERRRILRKHKSNDQKNMVRENKKNNYKSMSPVKKQALLENLELKYKENLHLKYKEMGPIRTKIFLEKQAMVYKAMHSSKKEAHRERNRANMKRKYHSMNEKRKKFKSSSDDVNLDHCISKFQSRIEEGPYYICSVCNRLLYRKSVKLLEKKKDIASFDNKEYICVTCHSKAVKGKIPCQAVYNNMSARMCVLSRYTRGGVHYPDAREDVRTIPTHARMCALSRRTRGCAHYPDAREDVHTIRTSEWFSVILLAL